MSTATANNSRASRSAGSRVSGPPEFSQVEVQAHLAKTLLRASRIASHKAALAERASKKWRRRHLQRTLSGLSLVILGVLGTLSATLFGLAKILGLALVLAAGLTAVLTGAVMMLTAPIHAHRSENRYAKQARQLAQLSRSIARA